jgi:hypothetical protein
LKTLENTEPHPLRFRKGCLCLWIIVTLCVLISAGAVAEQTTLEGRAEMRFSDYENLYFSILDLTAGPGDDAQFESLPEPAQALYILAILDMEVQNGGLCQFFVNCGSAYATRVSESLRTVGLEPMRILYETFLSDNRIDPSDLNSYHFDTPDDIAEQYERHPYDDFDDAYMELWVKLDFNKVMLQYADAHPEIFSITRP